jgi:hypothetical protein
MGMGVRGGPSQGDTIQLHALRGPGAVVKVTSLKNTMCFSVWWPHRPGRRARQTRYVNLFQVHSPTRLSLVVVLMLRFGWQVQFKLHRSTTACFMRWSFCRPTLSRRPLF